MNVHGKSPDCMSLLAGQDNSAVVFKNGVKFGGTFNKRQSISFNVNQGDVCYFLIAAPFKVTLLVWILEILMSYATATAMRMTSALLLPTI